MGGETSSDTRVQGLETSALTVNPNITPQTQKVVDSEPRRSVPAIRAPLNSLSQLVAGWFKLSERLAKACRRSGLHVGCGFRIFTSGAPNYWCCFGSSQSESQLGTGQCFGQCFRGLGHRVSGQVICTTARDLISHPGGVKPEVSSLSLGFRVNFLEGSLGFRI